MTMTTPTMPGQAQDAAPRFAVIGNPVRHSRSPWIHARFGEQTGLALHYGLLEAQTGPDDFRRAVEQFFAQGGRGLNVTVPFKELAHDLARADLSDRARAAQAVNTLWMHEGRLHGCNTDGVGLVQDILRQGTALRGSRILLVGAGGAAKGVLLPLLQSGCAHLRIVNRTAAKALQLAAQGRDAWRQAGGSSPLSGMPALAAAPQAGQAPDTPSAPAAITQHDPAPQLDAGGLPDAAGAWDIVINASSSSLQGQAPDLPDGIYAPGALAYDMMYGAQPTPFLRQAVAQGASRLVDGLGMLVGQAAESFGIWHGVRPDPEPVLAALRRELAGS